CFMAWQARFESAHPADAGILEVSTADWSKVDKSRLPASCFLWVEDERKKGSWHLPVYMGTGGIGKNGMYRERGPVNVNAMRAAEATIEGARTGKPMTVPKSVEARLQNLLKQHESGPESRYEAYRTPKTPRLRESGTALAHLVETVDFSGAEFVEEGGKRLVRNVVMLGPVSSHGYEYKQEAMRVAVDGKLYEGVRIFINHSREGRDLMHLAGIFRESKHEDGKIKGTAFLLDDDYGRKFWNIAQDMPEAAGCSHVADGKMVKEGGKKYVEQITRVHSVDLVVQGATTKHVFEDDDSSGKEDTMELNDVKIEDLRTARPDMARQLVQEGAASRDEEIQALINEKAVLTTSAESLSTEKAALEEQNKQLQAKIDEMTVLEATRQKESVVDKAMSELPEQARTDLFRMQCLGVQTGGETFDLKVYEEKVTELVKDRKSLCDQTGVRNQGGEQKRSGDVKTQEAEANAELQL
ncbi:MAG TPA: hypothetical protein VMY42_04280, partial [Thermoguttaceae bacterium]|nr:hypothetical protein [Thermoguttaceae bacterium]